MTVERTSARVRPRKATLELLPAGTRLGRYELLRRFASGGMAELYLARVAGTGGFEKLCVVKRILPQYAHEPDYVQMFLDEARLTAGIQHANVAQVYDVGEGDDGYFFAMEYVHGVDLRQVLHALSQRTSRLPLEHVVAIVIAAANGLHAAHERRDRAGELLGIVHRDVTPSNILLGFDGGVKLIDFGIAKAQGRATETRTGTLKGKIAYMSPEQCQAEVLDRRSDVFSLGIVLYEASTGTRLYAGDNEFAALRQIVDRDAPPPSARCVGYPAALEAIVMRALARDRERRYPTALALSLALEEFAADARLVTSTTRLGRFLRTLLPDRAAETAEVLIGATPPPILGRGTDEQPAVAAASSREDSVQISIATDPAPPTPSAVSAELVALLRVHRRRQVLWTVAIAAVMSVVIAVAVAWMTRAPRRQGPAPTEPMAPAPAVTSDPASPIPAPQWVARPPSPPPPSSPAVDPAPAAVVAEPVVAPPVRQRPPRDKSRRRASKSASSWDPDSALPPR